MLTTIEEKLSAIKAINDEKKIIEEVLDKVDLLSLDQAMFLKSLLETKQFRDTLRYFIKDYCITRRKELVESATNLMK